MQNGGQTHILVSNPGSASRKYALFTAGPIESARLHFESAQDGRIVCTFTQNGDSREIPTELGSIAEAGKLVEHIFKEQQVLGQDESITHVGLRVVAPSGYFMQDHVMNDDVVQKLKDAQNLAPLHISATLHELEFLRQQYPNAAIVGVSDSAFHATKPNYAWNYGINIHDADRLDIKRFGYHGLSV